MYSTYYAIAIKDFSTCGEGLSYILFFFWVEPLLIRKPSKWLFLVEYLYYLREIFEKTLGWIALLVMRQ